ncbi:hypothetical protein C8R43DRAFT_903808 [Mycena crocata]|nr:hypothetical protein C8R43DRAFT_903808 [Mycena crocata]
MDAAAARFRSKLARQSPTLAAAITEYTKRNARPPPRGFAKWHAFAQSRDFLLIDEFDSVSEDLEQFWGLSGRELRERAALAGRLPGIDLVRVRGGKARAVRVERSANGTETESGDGVSGRAQGLVAMMEAFVHELPDMDFPVNARPDGRVLVPWEHRAFPNLTEAVEARASTILDPTTWRPDWAGEGSVWDAWRRTCAPTAPARRLYSSLRVGGVGSNSKGAHNAQPELTFAEGTGSRAGTDWCAAPARRYEQGHLFADWRALPALVPVFSPARAPGFADIRIPSHYYWGGTRRYTYGWDPVNLEQHTVDAMEVPWEKKRDAVWWRGASTGGGSSPSGFSAGYQRHRFLRMATRNRSNTAAAGGKAKRPAVGTFTTARVPLSALNADVMDAAVVKTVLPIGAEHRVADSVEMGVGWEYKYLLDLDGNSYSGRFMAFLASDSVPVKATVYDEYFSGWLEPWVHYIPLSATYSEVYNIVAYFSGPPPAALRAANLSAAASTYAPARGSAPREPGDRRLRRIARAGKQWKKTMGRTADMEVYVYRLALEYGRLWADDREAMGYDASTGGA